MPVLRRLLGYFLRYKGRLVAVVVLSVLISVLYFGTVGSLKPMGDLLFEEGAADELLDSEFFADGFGARIARQLEGILSDKARAIYWLCGAVFLMTVLRNVFRFFQSYLTQSIEKFVIRDVNDDLFAKVERLPLRRFQEEEGIAATISRFTNDSYLLSSGVKNIFGKALIEPLQGLAALGVALWIDWKLTLTTILVLPVVAALIATLGRKVKKRARRSMERKGRIQEVLQENLINLPVVKAFGLEDSEHQRFQTANQHYVDNELRLARIDAATSPTMETITTLAVLFVIFVTARLVIEGSWSSGDFFAFYAALAALFDPVRKIGKLFNKFQQSMAAGERIFELMDSPTEVIDPPDAIALPTLTQGIRFESVNFHYRENEPVLHGIDLDIPAGMKLGIVGRTGHGKSTLVKLLLRYSEPIEGRITIDGTDLRAATLESLRSKIGLVSQNVLLFKDSIANNIARGRPGATREQVIAAARAAHAEEFIDQFPGRYDAMVGELGDTLSGGQKQRLSIARAILNDPEILILDEATSSLDSESEALIQDALAEFVTKRTCLIIAHRMSTLTFCDRIVVIERGRVEAFGTHDELMKQSATYRELFSRQAINLS